MVLRRLSLLFFIILFCANFTIAAEIHGDVYDNNLRKVSDVKLEIDTVPKQTLVSKDGSYSFTVPPGDYMLKAEHQTNGLYLEGEKFIKVEEEGDFVVDLILFEVLDEDEALLQESDINIEELKFDEQKTGVYVIVIAIIVILAGGLVFLKLRKPKEEKIVEELKDDSLEKVIKIIKDNDGRITQRELRKKFPLSEAKVSLMLTELEHEGRIKKIKKGRGNIIILKK